MHQCSSNSNKEDRIQECTEVQAALHLFLVQVLEEQVVVHNEEDKQLNKKKYMKMMIINSMDILKIYSNICINNSKDNEDNNIKHSQKENQRINIIYL